MNSRLDKKSAPILRFIEFGKRFGYRFFHRKLSKNFQKSSTN
jgi:hypothetical protein